MAQCTAKNSRGQRCQRMSIRGGSVCMMHGGSAPQVKAAAEARLRALADPSIGVLEFALKQKGRKLREAITAARDVLDRAGMGAVHKVEDVTPAESMTSAERLARLRALHRELLGMEETVQ